MAVEIGTLVLRGQFGRSAEVSEPDSEAIEQALNALRQEMLEAMSVMMDDAARRAREG